MADAAPGAHAVEQRVLLAVHADLDQVQDVARGGSLVPELLARGRPEHRGPGAQRLAQRPLVGVADEEHVTGLRVLQHHGKQALSRRGDLGKLFEVEGELPALFELTHRGLRKPAA